MWQRDFSNYSRPKADLQASDSLFQSLIWFYDFFLAYLMLSEARQGLVVLFVYFLFLGKIRLPEVANISKFLEEWQD